MDTVEGYLDNKKMMIDSILETYIPRSLSTKELDTMLGKIRYAHDPETASKALSVPIWDFFDRGGKRWRPALFLLVVEALNGPVEKVKDFCAVPELSHNGSIIIDDIEDMGETRRGKPCMHLLFGVDVAVNAGNFLYFLPLLIFQKHANKLDPAILLRAYRVYAEEMINIHIGQGTDIVWHQGKKEQITEAQYLQMVAFKTGCLAREAGRLAVALSGGSEDLERKIGRVCESIGIAFQIADDVLSLAGGEAFQKGKGFGDDITEGKRSLPVLYALQKLSDKERKRLIELLNMHTRDKKLIQEAIDLIKKTPAIAQAQATARRVVEEAWKEADPLLKPSKAKDLLHDFCRFAIERKM